MQRGEQSNKSIQIYRLRQSRQEILQARRLSCAICLYMCSLITLSNVLGLLKFSHLNPFNIVVNN